MITFVFLGELTSANTDVFGMAVFDELGHTPKPILSDCPDLACSRTHDLFRIVVHPRNEQLMEILVLVDLESIGVVDHPLA